MNGCAHDGDPRPSLPPPTNTVISTMAHYKSEISHSQMSYFTAKYDCQEILVHLDINDLGISNEIRTDAPLIGYGNEMNQMGGG
jgi:hypothetical protein